MKNHILGHAKKTFRASLCVYVLLMHIEFPSIYKLNDFVNKCNDDGYIRDPAIKLKIITECVSVTSQNATDIFENIADVRMFDKVHLIVVNLNVCPELMYEDNCEFRMYITTIDDQSRDSGSKNIINDIQLGGFNIQ